MDSNYQTPQRTPRSRRKALSPQSVYLSPYQVLELTPQTDDIDYLKKRVVEQDTIIQELRATVKDQQSKMNEKMDESILIETSNKISIQENRVHERDVSMYISEMESQKEMIRSAKKERDDEAKLRRSMQWKLQESESKVADLTLQLEYLEGKITDLEAKSSQQSDKNNENGREIRSLQDALSEANTKNQILEARLKQEQKSLKEMKVRVEGLNKSLEETRKRELELSVQLDNQKEARKSMEDTLSSLRNAEKDQVLREIQTISTQLITIPQVKLPDMSQVEQLGALKNTVEYKEREIERLKEREVDLQQQLEEEKSRVTTAEREIRSLKKDLLDSEDNKISTTLLLEAEKLKEQKAEIRCELIKQQKENKKLLEQMEKMDISDSTKEELSQKTSEIQSLRIEKTLLTEKVTSLSGQVQSQEELLKEKQEQVEEMVADKEEKSQLKKMRDGLEASNAELRKYLGFLDEQCEQYREKKTRAETGLKRAQEELQELREKMRAAERESDGVRASEAQISQLLADNERLENKIGYLKEELQECHSDYREELARMAREISESKRKARDANEQGDHSILITDLKKQISQHESTARSSKRQIEELKKDNEKMQSQVSDVLAREKGLTDENTRLRQGLSDAISKLEQYKHDLEDQREINQGLAEKLGENEERMGKLKDELADFEDAVDEKEGLISYLQSQINVKQLPKVSRRSTLLKTVSEVSLSSTTVESVDSADLEEVMELENQLSKMRKERDEKKQMLQERRNTPPTGQHFKAPLAPIREVQNLQTPRQTKGTMRHEIPHKWKDLRHLGIFSLKCAVCFVGVPTFAKARRCSHCGVIVHFQCSRRVVNTCGLPDECASFYLESHTAPVGRMNGWIRIFRDDTDSRSWDSCWALMDDKSISFYDKESVEGDLSKHFLRLDLSQENFLVRAGSAAPSNADACTQVASIIQLKLPKMSIYILAPSLQSAKRWTEALQAAQTRRMMLTRKPSSFSEQSCILTLNAPNNLTVHTTSVVEDCLLIGAKAGLFFTHLSSPRMPIRFGGVDSVLCLEVMPDINTVALITGQQKLLSILPLSTLRNQLNSAQPSVRLDVIAGLSHLHLLAFHQQDGQKFLFVADAVKLHMLKYNPNRDVFVLFHSVETSEPPMCLQSTPSGFFFGADSFYRVDLSAGTPQIVPLAPAHVADYPIAVLSIGNNELLLAYQNYGLFVTNRGERTREQVVEWEQMPMEFVYTAPFLYVIHYDSIEIMQVAENLGQQPCKTFFDEREVFSCQNAHIVGHRPNGDIFVSISSKDSTEVHKFNATQQRRTMKRRGISLSHFAASSDKRSKTTS